MEQHELTDLAAITDAKLDLAHFAKYFGYLRVSVSMWVNNRALPHPWRHAQLCRDLELVRTALKSGLLPVKVSARRAKYDATCRALDAARQLVQ
jgi:hypothetical protein